MFRFCGWRVVCGVARKIFGLVKPGYIGQIRSLRIAGLAASILFAVMTVAAFFPVVNKTDGADAAAMPATSSINITSTSNAASVNILLDNENGTFATSDSDIAFDVNTTNMTGYTVMIAGNGSAGKLLNNDYGDSLDTLDAVTDADTFKNGSADTFSNKWGFKPNKYNSADNVDYIPAPSGDEKTVLNVTGCANGTTSCSNTKDTYTIGVGARVGYEKSEGVYTNTYALNVVANPITYSFNYFDDTSDSSVADIPVGDSGSSVSLSEYTLPTAIPTRDAYVFMGWCDGTVTHVELGESACLGTVYAPGENYDDFNNPDNPNNMVNFYAMWDLSKYNITIKTVPGVSKVALNGVECTDDSGCVVPDLVSGQTYDLVATIADGYTFSAWNAGDYGTIAANNATTTYTVGVRDSVITPAVTVNKYDITIKTTTGVSKVALNGVECTSTSGCVVSGLTFGQSYSLSTTITAGYIFAGWNPGEYGDIADITATTTTYVVGAGNSTIVPSITAGGYAITIKTVTGVSKVTLNGAACTSASGCVVSNLTFGQTYDLVATIADGYTFSAWNAGSYGSIAANNATTTYTVGAGNSVITPAVTINQYTLTVNPNGGTWSGKTTSQTFTQNYNTTKVIDNPTAGPSYTISYNANSQGASYSNSPTSVQRPFTSWTKGGSGTLSGTTYTFGAGNGTLTANYNATSNAFTLPAITKTGHTCKWAKGSASGTQIASGGSTTITGNTTFYAVCTANQYTCKKQYRLQLADGSWGGWISDGSASVTYGTACNYSKALTNYKNSATGTNNSTASTSVNMPASEQTLSLNMYRNTYALTVNSGSGGGTYRWGQAVNISASAAATGKHFTNWSVSNATINNANAASATITMTTSTASATANYAWNTYTVKFNGKGGATSSGDTSKTQSFTYGTAQNLARNTFIYKDHFFARWNTKSDGTGTFYGDKVSVSNLTATNGATVNLYAVWGGISNCQTDGTIISSPLGVSMPTPATGRPCKVDGKTFVLGNLTYSELGPMFTYYPQKAAWNDYFTDGSGANTSGGTVGGTCPAGYSGATSSQMNALIKKYGGTAYTPDGGTASYRITKTANEQQYTLFTSLFKPDVSGSVAIWSRTQQDSNKAYRMIISDSSVHAGAALAKTTKWYVLCARTSDSY